VHGSESRTGRQQVFLKKKTQPLVQSIGIVKFLDYGFWFLLFEILKLFEIKLNEKNLSLIDAEYFSAPF
jgi:hypothetical protein